MSVRSRQVLLANLCQLHGIQQEVISDARRMIEENNTPTGYKKVVAYIRKEASIGYTPIQVCQQIVDILEDDKEYKSLQDQINLLHEHILSR